MFANVITVEYEGGIQETILVFGTDPARFKDRCAEALIDTVCRNFAARSGDTAEEIASRVRNGTRSFTSADDVYYITMRECDMVIDADPPASGESKV